MTTQPPEPSGAESGGGAEDDFLSTAHLRQGLGERSIRSGAVTVASQGLKFLITTVGTMVLARLVTPADFGLIAMVAPIVGMIGLVKDMGLTMATVQREGLTREQVSMMFWVSVAASVVLTACAIAVAPLVVWLYSDPRCLPVIALLASAFVFGGAAAQYQALMQRRMRFAALAVVEVGGSAFTLAVGIALAAQGYGYWAVAWMAPIGAVVHLLACWWMVRWIPGPPRMGVGIRGLLAFGGSISGFNVVNFIAANADKVLLGWLWNPYQVGLFQKSQQLFLLPLTQLNVPLSAVAIPALSRLQGEPEAYRRAYLRFQEPIALCAFPAIAFLVGVSDWIVAVLLGPQWSEAGPIFMLFAISGLTIPITITTGWLFVTQGRGAEFFSLGLVSGIVAILAIVIGLPYGARGVAFTSAMAILLIRSPLAFWMATRSGPVTLGDLVRSVCIFLPPGLVVLAAVAGLRQVVQPASPVVGLALAALAAAPAFLLAGAAIPPCRAALGRTVELVLVAAGRRPAR